MGERVNMANTDSIMTMREFYNAVIEAKVSDEVTAKAEAEVAKLDARNEKRTSKPSKLSESDIPLIAKLEDYLEGKKMIASDIAKALEMTPNKVASLAKASDKIVITKTRVKGREVNEYSLSTTTED